METSLLITKLSIPPLRGQLVTRGKLLDILQKCLDYSLTLISAPAGFGKTTLLSQCARQDHADFSIAWLSLDKSDDDPVRYWCYVISALQTSLEIDTEEAELLLRAPGAITESNIESFVTLLLNSLATIEKDFVIILDDYQLIESPAIHQSMIFLLEHLPHVMHVIIATREDPPFPLARFRGKDMLLTISSDELRFDLQDASRLLQQYQDHPLPEEDVIALNERTEGWAVGLKMAALSLKDRQDIAGFIHSFTGSQSYIMDYLLEEVLQIQPQDTRRFLLRTSVLDRLNGPLCDALTGDSDGQERLLQLERDHLFVVPLDEERQWYRYEHLFADLLHRQLLNEYGKEHVQELHLQASGWYEKNGELSQSIEHAIQANDWEWVMKLLETAKDEQVKKGEFAALSKWFRQIPLEIIAEHRGLHIEYCTVLALSGQVEEAEAKLDEIERDSNTNQNIMTDIAMSRVVIALRRNSTPDLLEALKTAANLVPEEKAAQRASLYQLLGWTYLYPPFDVKTAEAVLQEGRQYARRGGAVFNERCIISMLSEIERQRGNLRKAYDMNLRAIEGVKNSPVTILCHSALGVISYEWNNLDDACRHFQAALDLGKQIGIIEIRAQVRDYLAFVLHAKGDIDGSRDMWEQADFQAYRVISTPGIRLGHTAMRTTFSIVFGTLAEANEWGQRVLNEIDCGPYYWGIVPIRLLITQGQKSEAAVALDKMYEHTISGEAPVEPARVRLYQSLAAEAEDEALTFLTDALNIGESEGYVRLFVDEYRAVKPLLEKAVSKGIKPEYVNRLLTIIEQETLQRKTAQAGQPLLSFRELEILSLLSAGTANQDIAERLSISLSTVKTHVHHILEKLEARDRTQAIYRAKELNLL